MKDFPFSIYDFFAYLASGLLLLLIVGFAFDISWKIPQQATLQFAVAVVAAYTIGQVLGLMSGVLIEQYFVTKFLGRTDITLLGLEASALTPCNLDESGKIHRCSVVFDEPENAGVPVAKAREALRQCTARHHTANKPEPSLLIIAAASNGKCQLRTLLRGYRSRWLRRNVFGHAFEPLSNTTRRRILNRAKTDDVPIGGLFNKAFAAAKADEATLTRMNTFLYLYGFARNVCMAFALGSLALIAGSVYSARIMIGDWQLKLWSSLLCLLVAIAMLFRYMDFSRRYSAEVFNAYAYPPRQLGA